MRLVGGKRGAIYIKEQFLAQTCLDIHCLRLNVNWELENDIDIGAMRLQTLCPRCVHRGSGYNSVTEIGLWFHLYNYQTSLLCETIQHILPYSCQLLIE